MYDKDEIKTALLTLMTDPNAQALHTTLIETIQLAGKLPIKLIGNAATMNPLLWLATHDRAAFDKHMKMVDALRVKRGLAPLTPSGFDTNYYQAGFMAQGRYRRGRASTIENVQRPASQRLRGASRVEFERVVQAQWKKQLDAQIAAVRKAHGGTIPKDVYKAIPARFWAAVDVALDEKEAEIRRNK